MGKTALQGQAPDEQPFHSGDRIRKAREYVGQDRQTFAETIGIHRDTLAKYEETGKAKRSALISIAWASKVRLEWLETGELPWVDAGTTGTPNDPNRPVNAV
jgi:DNA-binding XRE family transcriptional regulator